MKIKLKKSLFFINFIGKSIYSRFTQKYARMGWFKDVWRAVWQTDKHEESHSRRASARISANNKAYDATIRVLHKSLETIQEECDYWRTEVKNKDATSTEEKLLNAGLQFFGVAPPSPPAPPHPPHSQSLESGRQYSEEEIKDLLGKTDQKYLKVLASFPESVAIQQVKKLVPDMSVESINTARKLAKEMIS